MLIAHDVQADEVEVVIRDENRMIIDLSDLGFLMKKYSGCSHFHIELLIQNKDKLFPNQLSEVNKQILIKSNLNVEY